MGGEGEGEHSWLNQSVRPNKLSTVRQTDREQDREDKTEDRTDDRTENKTKIFKKNLIYRVVFLTGPP